NDEKRIERCLKFLKFCDEIVIIDDNSTDKTIELAHKYSVKLTKHPLENDFAAQRNRLLEQSTGEWVLFIDPDEEVTTELANEIKSILKEPKYDVYFLKRVDFFWNQPIKYGELSTASKKGFIRLVKKGSGSWKGK
ncbi:MAG TPA: glycosyltransferase family 2 protein, partial [Candidatus Woesebacteria bacterium]|nr:glycosyltransferase family 2 protein [Candidatus Woesebacteria bacterium]